jgi:hypothetical protein
MGVTSQAPAATTGGRVFELKAKGEEKSEDTLDKRFAIVKQTKIGRFVVKINGDGPVVAGLAGGVAHGSSSGQMVGAAADPQWGKTCLMARRPRQRWALSLNTMECGFFQGYRIGLDPRGKPVKTTCYAKLDP